MSNSRLFYHSQGIVCCGHLIGRPVALNLNSIAKFVNLFVSFLDIPKSCEQIRDFNIGKSDGQYVLEARKGCHLSVICQNMEDKHPKEFLGGPNQREWSAYPFAALIKISTHTKENIQSGACLENSGWSYSFALYLNLYEFIS